MGLFLVSSQMEGQPMEDSSWLTTTKVTDPNLRADKALAAVRSAIADSSGTARLNAELALIEVLLQLNKVEEAKTHLDSFNELAKEEGIEVSKELNSRYITLLGIALHRSGSDRESAALWEKLQSEDTCLFSKPAVTSEIKAEPSPIFSTP